MFKAVAKFLSGGVLKSVENIALEAIQTDKETAEAQFGVNGVNSMKLEKALCSTRFQTRLLVKVNTSLYPRKRA